ncbi:putative eggshell protein [Neltuma alba]|uniref:putative eggshell protein n=1 Tax=Neltuma alba TaxID=207710 RepID=UPI0010A340B9|nr:putative eggshell protein [Prosopis alba]
MYGFNLRMQKKGRPRMSVPQFGGWDQNGGADVSSGYTVVFSKARADRQHQKTDLSEVKRQTHQLQDHHHLHHDNNNLPKNQAHHHHHHHHHKRHDRHVLMNIMFMIVQGKKRNKIMSWIFCCIRP